MHPKYLQQVLRDRGMPTPPLRQLERFVAMLSEAEAPRMEDRLRKIAQGVEQQEDADALLQGIRAAAPADPDQQAAAPEPATRKTPSLPAAPVPARTQRLVASEVRLPPDVLSTLRRHGMHVYATSAALKIELGTLRAGEDAGTVEYTVQVEAARAKGAGYDWQGKVPFQFTRRELPLLAATLLGVGRKKLASGNHGPNTDKHFELEDQESHLYVKVRVAGCAPISLPVGPADVFGWGEICLVAMHLNRPLVGTEGQLALLRRIGRMEGARD